MLDHPTPQVTDSHFDSVVQALSRACAHDGSKNNKLLSSVASLALNISRYRDLPTRQKSLAKASMEVAYSALRYTQKELSEAEAEEPSPETKANLGELIRTLEEISSFLVSRRSRNWFNAVTFWAMCLWDNVVIKSSAKAAFIQRGKTVDRTLMLENRLATLRVLFNMELDINRSRSPFRLENADGSSRHAVVEAQSSHSPEHTQPGMPKPSQSTTLSRSDALTSAVVPASLSPPAALLSHSSSTVGFFDNARDFAIVVLPGASISFNQISGNQSIVTNTQNLHNAAS
ncbi:hypothetical protein V5O48_013536 [Marasmius crinis-equi]|uniref:Uncharacterized protein n=1 Tax=Marasmius crinis-equi TaxID=585013 RepID=A0ABR3F065_9AGAR